MCSWKSGFLAGDDATGTVFYTAYCSAWVLCVTSSRTMALSILHCCHAGSHKAGPRNLKQTKPVLIRQQQPFRTSMGVLQTYCSVRWISRLHVGAHRSHASILANMEWTNVEPQLISDLHCIFCDGILAQCNVSLTEHNFQAYYDY